MRYLTIVGLLFTTLVVYAQDVTATAYQTVNVRSGPGTQFDIIGQLQEGDVVPVLAQDSPATRWLHIALEDELTGWVAIFTVTLEGDVSTLAIFDDAAGTSNPESEVVTVISFGRVNVRSGPSINYDTIGQLDVDDTALVLARSNTNNDWLYIENDLVVGWVAYFTVRVDGSLSDMPVRVPDTITGELVEPTVLIETNFNVQIHTRPAFSAPVTATIEFDTQVTPTGISRNRRWLYIVYEGQEGWAWIQLLDVTPEQLADLPVRDPAIE